MKRLLAYLFIVLGLVLTFNVNTEAGIIPYEPKANQIILINSNTNQILYEKNSNQKINPGSFTKIMTSIIVFDAIKNGQISLKDKLRVSKKAWKISTSGYSAMFVMNGDSISVENLLRGLIVASGNDAAIVLAEGLAGSENNFVKLMNDKAKEIGLNYTKFGNSTGIIIPTNTTTVKDVAIMSSYLINNYPELYYFFGEKQFTWNRTGGDPITQGNRNPLLYKNMNVDGLRTSYNQTDRYGLASSMYLKNNDDRLIVVGSGFKDKNDRSRESAKLLTFGKTNYHTFKIAKKEPSQTQKVAIDKNKFLVIHILHGYGHDKYKSFIGYDKNKNKAIQISKKNCEKNKVNSYDCGDYFYFYKGDYYYRNKFSKEENDKLVTSFLNPLYKKEFVKAFKIIKNQETQIAKAEPSQTQKVEGNIDDLNLNDKYLLAPGMKAYFFTGQYKKEQKKDDSFIILSTPTFIKYYDNDLEELIAIDKLGNWKMTNITKENSSKHLKLRISEKTYFKMADVMNVEGRKNIFKSIIDKGEKDKLTDLIDEYLSYLVWQKKITKNKANKKKLLLTEYFLDKDKDKKTQIAKAEPTITPKKKVKVAKVEETKQEEFKPENKDNEAPVIEIAEAITVNDSTYEIEGKVIDKSKKLFVQIDGETIPVKKGKFKIKRFSPVDEQLKIVALDQWGNKSKPKLVNITIELKETELVEKLEQLNPSLIKSKSNKNRVALIIGIEKYEQTPAANFANLDAQYFYEYARKGFGIPKSNIRLLVDEDADLVKSISSINKWLPSKIKKNKTELIIFFAGHGLASNNGQELYILPQDSDPDLLSRTALSRTELFEQIISLSPKSVTMFMDTCYSGISRDEKMLLASARPIRIVADDQEGIPDNFTIFTASKLDQISSGLEEAKHGIFSYYLMKGLEGKADENKDKKITNGELLAYMDENVSQKASELGRQQNPSLAGDPDKVLISYR